MGRRLIFVFLIALLVAALFAAVGAGAYHAGMIGAAPGGGHIVRVVPGPGYYWGYRAGWGFFPGFFLFPLVLLLILVAVFWRRPWHRHWGYGLGAGPGTGGPGGEPQGWVPRGPRQYFEEWHRQAHAGA